MDGQKITVVYRWTAKPGTLDALKAIYEEVRAEMEATEPGTLRIGKMLSKTSARHSAHGAVGLSLQETKKYFPPATPVAGSPKGNGCKNLGQLPSTRASRMTGSTI